MKQARMLMLLLLFVACPTRTAADIEGFAPQCSSPYTTLSNSTRHLSFNDGNDNVEWCDDPANYERHQPQNDWTGPGLYRFTGAAGTTLALQAPTIFSCGTDAGGWLNGVLPLASEQMVPRTVCFRWRSDSCFWSAQVSVAACDGFYLFDLPAPPTACLRYCGGSADPPPTDNRSACDAPVRLLTSFTRSALFNDGNNGIEACDNGALGQVSSGDPAFNDWRGPGYYRITGAAGEGMALTPPTPFSCGTDAGGWLNGSLPVPVDGVVYRKVCFVWNSNPCQWSATIQVVACKAGFALYNLPAPPTVCLRYCGAGVLPTVLETASGPNGFVQGSVRLLTLSLGDVVATRNATTAFVATFRAGLAATFNALLGAGVVASSDVFVVSLAPGSVIVSYAVAMPGAATNAARVYCAALVLSNSSLGAHLPLLGAAVPGVETVQILGVPRVINVSTCGTLCAQSPAACQSYLATGQSGKPDNGHADNSSPSSESTTSFGMPLFLVLLGVFSFVSIVAGVLSLYRHRLRLRFARARARAPNNADGDENRNEARAGADIFANPVYVGAVVAHHDERPPTYDEFIQEQEQAQGLDHELDSETNDVQPPPAWHECVASVVGDDDDMMSLATEGSAGDFSQLHGTSELITQPTAVGGHDVFV